MIRFFRKISIETPIYQITGLTQIFSYLSCRATAKHLKILMVVQRFLDFSLPSHKVMPSAEVTSHETAPSLNPKNPRFLC